MELAELKLLQEAKEKLEREVAAKEVERQLAEEGLKLKKGKESPTLVLKLKEKPNEPPLAPPPAIKLAPREQAELDCRTIGEALKSFTGTTVGKFIMSVWRKPNTNTRET